MAKLETFTKPEMAMIVVSLLRPKMVSFIRRKKAAGGVTDIVKFTEEGIKAFFDQPQNFAAKKAFAATPYQGNYALLAKKIAYDI